jgi:hypothetical protein
MPFGDRTGPLGLGPRTGRAMGYCAGFPGPGSMNLIPGRGWYGFGRGWRNWYRLTGLPGWARAGYDYPTFAEFEYPYGSDFTDREEVDILRDQAEFLKKQLDNIQTRISTLEKAKTQESE